MRKKLVVGKTTAEQFCLKANSDGADFVCMIAVELTFVLIHICHFYHHCAIDTSRCGNDRTSELKNNNFLMRMLLKQCGCSASLYISQS